MTYTSALPAPVSRLPELGEPWYSLSGRPVVDRLRGLPVPTCPQPLGRDLRRVRAEVEKRKLLRTLDKQLDIGNRATIRAKLSGEMFWRPGEWEALQEALQAPPEAGPTADVTCVGCGGSFMVAANKARRSRWCSPDCRKTHYKRPDR